MIKYSSVNYETIKQDLISYVKSKPYYDAWKDFYESGSGTTLIQLMSGLGTFLSFHSMAARRESNLFYARLRSSVYGIADLLGYPVNRRSAAILNLTIEWTGTDYQFHLFDPDFFDPDNSPVQFQYDMMYEGNSLGTTKSYPITFTNDTTVNLGSNYYTQDTGVQAIVGTWKRYIHKVSESKNFYEIPIVVEDIDNIDNQYIRVYVNRVHKTTTRYVEELEDDSESDNPCILLKTLGDRVVVIFGDGVYGIKPNADDEVVIDFLQVAETDNTELDVIENISITGENLVYATVSGATLYHPQYSADSLLKITRVAPGYFASKRRMVTLEDHEYVVMSQPGIISAKAVKSTDESECCTCLIAYLYDDLHVMDETEETSMLAALDDHRIQGEQIILVDPVPVYVYIQMTVVVYSGANTAEIEADTVEYITNNMVRRLGGSFKVGEILYTVNNMANVRRAYIHAPAYDYDLMASSPQKYWKYFTIIPQGGGGIDMTFSFRDTGQYSYGDIAGGYIES